jgi:hypothetical protein
MTMRLPPKLTLLAILSLLQGCPSPPVDPAAVASAEVYFPPRFQYVAEPRFCFSPAERERAIQECEKMGANTLFEFVIDNAGHVKQARVVKTSLWRDRVEPMEEHARIMVFSADPKSALYRAFYFPADYTYKSTFEWQN